MAAPSPNLEAAEKLRELSGQLQALSNHVTQPIESELRSLAAQLLDLTQCLERFQWHP